VLIAEGQLRYDDFINGWRLTAKRVRSADEAIQEYARRITIRWPSSGNGAAFVRELQRTLQPFRGGKCEVCIQYASSVAAADVTLGDKWSVRLTRELRDQLTRLLGDDRFSIHYPKHFV
jgi:DNA polymerase-3 subunit alpha